MSLSTPFNEAQFSLPYCLCLLPLRNTYDLNFFEFPNFSWICHIEDPTRSLTTLPAREILSPSFPGNELCHDCLLLCPEHELIQPSSKPAIIPENYTGPQPRLACWHPAKYTV